MLTPLPTSYDDLPSDQTADGRPEWQVMREMEERVAVWLAKKTQERLLRERIKKAAAIRKKSRKRFWPKLIGG